ncbi:BamA/TamA family outer membrane protein [candidate division WOR-3 bacterium]|nr:BamA/TamA family outer membrane protein [candidate division WOR-3 bacterium]
MVASCFRLCLLLLLLGAGEGRIRRIRFKGNRHFSSSRLSNVIYTTRKELYSPSMVVADSAELVRFYRNQGFSWVEVTTQYLASRDKLTYYINEGERLKVKSIRAIGASASDENAILAKIPIKKRSPFTLFGEQETERLTKKYYKDRGYPYVVVNIDTVTYGTEVELTLSVVPGKRTWISSISFSGVAPSAVNPDFLMRTTGLKAGERYSAARLDRASRLLYSTSLFSRVRMNLLAASSGREDSLDVVFQLTPAKTRAVLVGGGVQTAENEFIPDRLLLSLGWEHLNLLHRGVTLSSEVTLSPTFRGNYETGFEIRNRYPNILPWGLALALSPYWKHRLNRDTVNIFTHTLGGEAGIERDFSDKLRAGLSAQAKKVWQIPENLPFDGTGSTNFLRLSLIYDSRDDFFNPKSGVFFSPYADWAGRPFGGNNDFLRLNAELRNYLALPFGSVLAWRLRGGLIAPHSGMRYEDISLFEKFTLGGSGTVRAVSDRALGPDSILVNFRPNPPDSVTGEVDTTWFFDHYGTFLLLYSFELRTPYMFNNLIGFAFFVDVGMCARDGDAIRDEDRAWGPGAGIRINTPIGPVRIDYAKNAAEPFKPFKESWTLGGRIELGFLQAF